MATVLNKTTMDAFYVPSVAAYDPADWIHNPDLSNVAGHPKRYWKIVGQAVQVMDPAEKEVVDLANLPADKLSRYEEIDNNNKVLIEAGLKYQGNNLSLVGHEHLYQSFIFSWNKSPVKLTAKDGTEVVFTKRREIKAFLSAVYAQLEEIRDSGEALKSLMRAAISKTELDSIVDTRTPENLVVKFQHVARAKVTTTRSDNKALVDKVEWFATDNGDGTYDDLVQLDQYTYNSDLNVLQSITKTRYNSDGEAVSSETEAYYTNAVSNTRIVKGDAL